MLLLLLVFESVLHLGEIKIFTSSSAKYVQNVQTSGLEVRGGVVRLGNEELTRRAVIIGIKDVTDLDEPLLNGAQESQTRLNFGLRIGCLHCCRYYGDKPALGCHLVRVAHHGDVDVRISSNLLLWDDDLRRQGVLQHEMKDQLCIHWRASTLRTLVLGNG